MSSMFCKKIYQCRNADWCARDFNPKSDCPECFEQLTNYDLLISKTPEELAEWLDAIIYHAESDNCGKSCPLYSYCIESNGGMLDWLKAPVEVDNGKTDI